MTEILKPCPFCGETASIERYGDPRQSTIYQCDNCSCRLETGEEWGHGKLWNRRSDLALIEERDRLREALKFYADEMTWADTNPKNDGRLTVLVPSPSFAEIDRGERARAALNPEGAS